MITNSDAAIAVVGAACRLPGGIASPSDLWDALNQGRDLVGEVPEGRWDIERFHGGRPRIGRITSRAGGFLADVSGFDPAFFRISPREAAQIDPQQRLLLELAWEGLEDAGIPAGALAGTATGVFIGISANDYAALQWPNPAGATAYTNAGGALSIASNRISYAFDLKGPSLSIDTACSSSLVALHQAAASLSRGESSVAIVGGVNLLLGPFPSVGFSAASMLSPTGRCHSFGGSADGYVRAEGGIVIILKRLADAEADGDRILAVIAGSGVNSDGRTDGLSMPNEHAQAALLTSVYSQAGIRPDEVTAFEAHGTGTPAGDPVECRAIGTALGIHRRSTAPLPIGSIKTNIGHVEPASGLAGLLKALLTIRHRRLPATINVGELNPAIPFAALNLHVARESLDLSGVTSPIIVGVNSFGFGGTNAHVVLREYSAPAARPVEAPARRSPLLLSAPNPEALAAVAERYAGMLSTLAAEDWEAVCSSAAHHRTHHRCRAVVAGADPRTAAAQLQGFASSGESLEIRSGRALEPAGSLALVFSGNGCQWWGMGERLRADYPEFRERHDQIAHRLLVHGGPDILAPRSAAEGALWLARTDVAQPALFAVQAALVDTLRTRGLQFDAVVGHSAGEVAAAYAAGALDLDDAVMVTLQRSRLQHLTHGAMAALGLGAEAARAAIAPFAGRLELSGINSPSSVSISGDGDSIDALGRSLDAGVFFRRLDLGYAFHSSAMEPLKEALLEALAAIEPTAGHCRFVSTVDGEEVDGAKLDRDYWWRNIRQHVRFADAVEFLIRTGTRVFLEVGPHPVLRTYLDELLRASGVEGRVLGTLRRQADESAALEAILPNLHVAGLSASLLASIARQPQVALPAYPWQRTAYWFAAAPATADATPARPAEHPLLGHRTAQGQPSWTQDLDLDAMPFLADHAVGGTAVFPGAAFVELMCAATHLARGVAAVELARVEIGKVLPLTPGPATRIETSIADDDGRIEIRSRAAGGQEWAVHATGRAVATAAPDALGLLDLDAIRQSLTPGRPPGDFYADAAARGLCYGPAFQRLTALWVGDDEVLVSLAPSAAGHYRLAPEVLDGALQSMLALLPTYHGAADRSAYLPVGIARARVTALAATAAFAHVRVTRRGPRSLRLNVQLSDAAGVIVAEFIGARARRIELARPAAAVPAYVEQTVVVGVRPESERVAGVRPGAIDLHDLRVMPHALAQRLDRLCGAYAKRAVAGLAGGDDADLAALAAAGVVDLPLAARLLDWTAQDATASLDPDEEWRVLLETHPELLAELTLIGRLGDHLIGVLSGRTTIEDLLVQDGGVAVEHFEDAGPTRMAARDAAWQALVRVMASRITGRALSVLHLGARTGELANRQAHHDPASRVVVADRRETWRPAVESRLGQAVEWRSLDPALPLAGQGFAAAEFDIVMLDDSVFLSSGLDPLVAHVLKSGGAVIVHGTTAGRLEQLAFGGHRSTPSSWADASAPAVLVACAQSSAVEILARDGDPATAAATDESADQRTVLLFVDQPDGHVGGLAAAFEARGHCVASVAPVAAGDAVLSTFGNRIDDVVYVVAPGAAGDQAIVDRALAVRDLVRACSGACVARVWLLTQATGDADDLAAAPLRAFARVLMNEFATIELRSIHLDAASGAGPADVVLAIEAAGEREIVLRGDIRCATRIVPAPAGRPGRAPSAAFVADVLQPGDLDSVCFRELAPRPPLPHQVAVAVRAAALNFHDMMWANGMLPDEAVEQGFVGATLGMEFAGVVTAVGDAVTSVAVGDRVMGFAPASLASQVTTPAGLVGRMPPGLSFEAAATMPSVCFTVLYALEHQARLERGESLLVHSAAGGVGLAAIQWARHRGVRVLATAGTTDKREFLARAGVEQIFDSRSIAFADGVRAASGGGVDAVLNSLAGEAIPAGLSVLRPFGRFIELGKRDLYANSRIGLRPFGDNLTFHGIDVDQLLNDRPALTFTLFARMMALIADRVFQPLPHRVFSIARVVEAMRLMQRGRHVGKIVLSVDTMPPVLAPPAVLDPDATYLVTGGLAGFGSATAEWLAEQGARHLVLVSRQGLASAGSQAAVDRLASLGAKVVVAAADVTDRQAMAAVFADISATGRRLGGIVHAAAVFADATAVTITREQMSAVLAPKVAGARNLHELSRHLPLDFFLLYSSSATSFGNPGQGSYVAANAYLEALASSRRAAGLPALAIAWGAIADVGVLSRTPSARAHVEDRLGVIPLSSSRALSSLAGRLANTLSPLIVAEVEWPVLLGRLAIGSLPRFEAMAAAAPVREAGSGSLRERATGLSQEQAVALIEPLVREEVARVLRLPAERVDAEASLGSLGMDSLMVVELQTALDLRHGCDVPAMQMIPLGTRGIARVIADRFGQIGAAETTPETWVDELSDAEVDALLAAVDGEEAA